MPNSKWDYSIFDNYCFCNLKVILKHNAHDKVLKCEESDDGLDFFYKNKMQAHKLVDFLETVIPLRVKPSK